MFVSVLRLVERGYGGNANWPPIAYTLVYKALKISKMIESREKNTRAARHFRFRSRRRRRSEHSTAHDSATEAWMGQGGETSHQEK
jgi:hypothetical protein